jgi:cytochrome c oxidase cbb3-type subunit 4
MTHETVVQLVGTYGQLYIIAIFVIAALYALWPRNRKKFERAARIPMDDHEAAAAPKDHLP